MGKWPNRPAATLRCGTPVPHYGQWSPCSVCITSPNKSLFYKCKSVKSAYLKLKCYLQLICTLYFITALFSRHPLTICFTISGYSEHIFLWCFGADLGAPIFAEFRFEVYILAAPAWPNIKVYLFITLRDGPQWGGSGYHSTPSAGYPNMTAH